MKKNKLTYAQKAKQIIAKYKRRLGDDFERHDKLSKEALDRELSKLMEQQEEAKQQTVQSMYSEMAYGGDLLPFEQEAPQYRDLGSGSLNFSYVNPMTGEPSSTNYKGMDDFEFAPSAPQRNVPKRQTKEDIEAYRLKIAEGVKRAEKEQSKKNRRDFLKSLKVSIVPVQRNPNFFLDKETVPAIAYGGELPQLDGSSASFVPPYSPEYAEAMRSLRHETDNFYNALDPNIYPRTLKGRAATMFMLPQGNIYDTAYLSNPYDDYGPTPRTVLGQGTYGPGTHVTPTASRTTGPQVSRMKSAPMPNPAAPQYGGRMLHVGNNIEDDATNTKNSWWSEIPTESKVGAISQLAGVLGSGIVSLTAGKPKPLTFNPTEAPEVSYVDNSEQLASAKRSYRGAANSLRYLSPSQYAAAMSNLAAQEAATKAGIIEGTNNTNVGIRNDAAWRRTALDQSNEQTRMRVEAMNEAARLGHVNNVGQMLTNTAGVVAGFARDESMRKTQNDMMRFTNTSNYGTKVINGRTVFTNRSGSLEYYTDPQGNPHWEDGGQPISKTEFLKRVKERYKHLNP